MGQRLPRAARGEADVAAQATWVAAQLTLLDTKGAEVASFALPAGTYAGAVIDSKYLYTLRDGTVEAYDLMSGALALSAPEAPPADEDAPFGLTSTAKGIVTYLRDNTAHVGRMSDGARFKIKKQKRNGIVDVELTSKGGLYYAFNSGDPSAPTGHVGTKLAELGTP